MGVLRSSWCCPPVASLLVLACGGTPPSSPPTAPSVAYTLPAGTYDFAVSQNAGPSGALGFVMCLGVGTFPNSLQIPVTLEVDGSSYRARSVSGSLSIDLRVSSGTADGTVRGNAGDGSGQFSMFIDGPDAVSISGQVTGERTASGTVAGKINLAGPQGYGGCSAANWSLTAR